MIRRPVFIAIGLSLLLTACGGMTLHEPSNGATINTATVNVRATWTDIQGSPDFALDGTDVTLRATAPVSPRFASGDAVILAVDAASCVALRR